MSLILNYQITDSEGGSSILKYLKRQEISRKTMVAIKHRGGEILVNGHPQIVHYKLKVGDQVTVIFPKEVRSEGLKPYALTLDIVYEDDYLMVINKPKGLPTIPSIRYPHKTLANGLIHYYNEQHLKSTIHFVNRLDRETSGLLIVAKHRHIHHVLTKEIKQIKRKYYALLKGELGTLQGTISEPIAREKEGNVRRCVRADGQQAVTHYRVLETWSGMTLVECQLETGRTHQIRVHFAHLGFPLIGDALYDEDGLNLGQFLHSYQVQFQHPITKVDHSFETPLPIRFKEHLTNSIENEVEKV